MVCLEKHGIFGVLNCIYEKNISPKAEKSGGAGRTTGQYISESSSESMRANAMQC